jgi:hypothetical protein
MLDLAEFAGYKLEAPRQHKEMNEKIFSAE